jgi:bifunctional DNA-binding transcriptional regulator/antitoxin component of YhaV-PrlF toxin-antitoxin module
MAIVRVKTKYQVTLPTAVRERAGVNIGDVLEAKVEKGKITLTPKSVVDRHLAESLADFKAGRIRGPFGSVGDMIASLKGKTKKRSKK